MQLVSHNQGGLVICNTEHSGLFALVPVPFILLRSCSDFVWGWIFNNMALSKNKHMNIPLHHQRSFCECIWSKTWTDVNNTKTYVNKDTNVNTKWATVRMSLTVLVTFSDGTNSLREYYVGACYRLLSGKGERWEGRVRLDCQLQKDGFSIFCVNDCIVSILFNAGAFGRNITHLIAFLTLGNVLTYIAVTDGESAARKCNVCKYLSTLF